MVAKYYIIRPLWLVSALLCIAPFCLGARGCEFTKLDTTSGSSEGFRFIIKADYLTIINEKYISIRGINNDKPKCEVSVPAQAVDTDTEIDFIPFRQKEDLPASLPEGYEFLGGANLKPKHPDKVNFNSGKEADAYVILPEGIRAEELSNADIRLMEFIDGHWVIVLPEKKGKVYTNGPHAGYIGPDEAKPAKLTCIRPFCWVRVKPPLSTPPPEDTTVPVTTTDTPPPTTTSPPSDQTPPPEDTTPVTDTVIPPPTIIIPPPDTTAPSMPTGLVATYTSSTQILLFWNGSTDNVGVAGYKIYRNGTLISTLSSVLSYSDTGLSPNVSYSYTVVAYDSAGNTSSYSNAFNITIPSPPDVQPPATTQTAVDDYVWVANCGYSKVTRVKKSDSTTTIIAVGSGPVGVAVDKTYVWVANINSNNVTRIRKSDLTTTTIAVGTYPEGVAVDETYCWVANTCSNNVTRIKKSDLTTTTITVGNGPCGVAVDETYCWVTNGFNEVGGNSVTRIKKSDLTTTTIAVGIVPNGVTVDETYCWVANTCSNNVTRIKKSDLTTTTITVGNGPCRVAVDTNYAWVVNTNSNSITRIRKSDLTTTTIMVGNSPSGVAVDETYCWVTNPGSNNITRILKSDLTTTAIAVGISAHVLGDMTGYAYDYFFRNPASEQREDTWTNISTTSVPSARFDHSAVWTGSKMVIWGGNTINGITNTGAIYDQATDTWTKTVDAFLGKMGHTTIWTGNEMIVWGGKDVAGESSSATGARYNPNEDKWLTMSASPLLGRYYHTAVWTGNEMIIWGGAHDYYDNTGAKYNPSTNTWSFISTTGAPPLTRQMHTAVWTGKEMIIWGGWQAGPGSVNTGAKYNPASDTWTPISTINAPSPRYEHTAVWTGTKMIIWGGNYNDANGTYYGLNNGGIYDPAADTWTPISNTNTSSARSRHTAIWTGNEMIIWGGQDDSVTESHGARYNPLTNSWVPMATTSLFPRRSFHTAVWTGSDMILWGGLGGGQVFNTGAKYSPASR